MKPTQPQTPQAAPAMPKMELDTPMKTLQEQDKSITGTPGQGGENEMGDAEGGETKKWTKRPKPQGCK